MSVNKIDLTEISLLSDVLCRQIGKLEREARVLREQLAVLHEVRRELVGGIAARDSIQADRLEIRKLEAQKNGDGFNDRDLDEMISSIQSWVEHKTRAREKSRRAALKAFREFSLLGEKSSPT